MPVADSQGVTLKIGGYTLGSITDVSVDLGVDSEFDCTSQASPVIGTGVNARVMTQRQATSVSAPTVSFSFIGAPGYGLTNMGSLEKIEFSFSSGWSLIGFGYLASYSVEASVGELLRGSATIQFSGFY